MNLEKFASRGLKAQAAVDELAAPVAKISRRPASATPGAGSSNARNPKTTPAGRAPVAHNSGNRGAERDKLSDQSHVSRSSSTHSEPEREWAKGRGMMAPNVVVQQVHWSEDQRWLRALMVDRDQAPTIRQAAQKRLRKLTRGPRL